mmetsp:Transcript_15813/g.36617  ORF Transcript_15813/g.36617 Transcript_15813/m.36617 type:complete len:426 (+) Transcript_15813:171-1448(+)|eukprot:CAMPEP_0197185006 /NCGR_PEP_ID=MMETSP1423-20130617/11054_1 /TAXON_ID=476441 /ORGANISM="Pseudo-nitzschia heimii, Strain UNC1101" /LENGTH=425 /DNA_ID=CAMNT_0042635969 /DNA_START=148 /DNA_END=1425 /DNA_ORIENTATION=-
MINRVFIPRIPRAPTATYIWGRKIVSKTTITFQRGLKSPSHYCHSESKRMLTIGGRFPGQNDLFIDTVTNNSKSKFGRATNRIRHYHHKGPTSYHESITDDDPPASNGKSEPGSKAFILESDRLALVDLFRKHALPERKGSLDRKALGLVLKAVGESPDEETLERIFQDADLDGNGAICLEEFLISSDKILGSVPAGMVLLVGGPGSGKGLLSKRLVKECGIVHISSGDLLREEVDRGTPLGQEVQEIMIRGDLVSSAVIVTLMKRKMRLPENAGKRVLLDGFPRSIQNATDLVELCGQPELALHLQCDDTVLIERILKRKDEALQSTDHVGVNESKKKVRDDDNIRTALKRLRNYHKYLHVTIEWLRENHVPVVNLDCDCPPDQVWEQLLAIGRLMRPATTIDKDDLSIISGRANDKNIGGKGR